MNTTQPRTEDIGDEFVRSHLEGNPVTLKSLASRYGRSYVALRMAASNGKWTQRAAAAVVARDSAVAGEGSRHDALVAMLMDESVGREVEVRRRHALMARRLQMIALGRLAALTPGEISPKVAVEMLKVGIEGERLALGLQGSTSVCDSDTGDDSLREAVHAATEILARFRPPGPSPTDEVGLREAG